MKIDPDSVTAVLLLDSGQWLPVVPGIVGPDVAHLQVCRHFHPGGPGHVHGGACEGFLVRLDPFSVRAFAYDATRVAAHRAALAATSPAGASNPS